jgi:hypothetical protein
MENSDSESVSNIKLKDIIQEYTDNLSIDEKIVMKIAEKQLQSSFSIEKSIGFLEWKNNKFKNKIFYK